VTAHGRQHVVGHRNQIRRVRRHAERAGPPVAGATTTQIRRDETDRPTSLSATQGQAACDPVMPYTASTGGPLPHRATKRSPPVTGTVR